MFRGDAVADLAQLILACRARPIDDLCPHDLATETGVLVGVMSAQAVIDVQRRDAVAELAEHVPGAGRVGAARNEDGHVAAWRDELQPAGVVLHPGAELGGFHRRIVAICARAIRRAAPPDPSAPAHAAAADARPTTPARASPSAGPRRQSRAG